MSAGPTKPTTAAIIPVRIESQRLPGKAMLAESGQPLFLHTWQCATAASCFDGGVYIATDSDEVDQAAQAAGAQVVRTSPTPRTGSERCAEALASMPEQIEYIVDIQGDWPETAAADLDALAASLQRGDAPIATLAVPLQPDDSCAADANVVKVVRDRAGRALLFSRAELPFRRGPSDSGAAAVPTLRHVGVYAFTRDALLAIPSLPSSGLAETESLEQLRFLENGISIQVLDATGCPWGIESRPDYDAFLQRLGRTES